jgi:endo-1,4-beta-xylanase
MNRILRAIVFAALALTILVAKAQAPITLKDAYRWAFAIGTAVNAAQFSGQDTRGAALVKTHFRSVTPENVLKWENVHPRLDAYAFDLPDKYVIQTAARPESE